MPASSKSQQSLMAVALQVREGDKKLDDIESPDFKEKVKEIVDGDMTNKELRNFAETDTKNLPDTIDESSIIENYKLPTFRMFLEKRLK